MKEALDLWCFGDVISVFLLFDAPGIGKTNWHARSPVVIDAVLLRDADNEKGIGSVQKMSLIFFSFYKEKLGFSMCTVVVTILSPLRKCHHASRLRLPLCGVGVREEIHRCVLGSWWFGDASSSCFCLMHLGLGSTKQHAHNPVVIVAVLLSQDNGSDLLQGIRLVLCMVIIITSLLAIMYNIWPYMLCAQARVVISLQMVMLPN